MSRPRLVIVMAETCGHCRSFKSKQLPTLIKNMEKEGKVDVTPVQLPDMSSDISSYSNLPKEVQKYVAWFPTFLLFNSGVSGTEVPLVMNGQQVGDSYVPKNPLDFPMTAQGVADWVSQNSGPPRKPLIDPNAVLNKGVKVVLTQSGQPVIYKGFLGGPPRQTKFEKTNCSSGKRLNAS